MSELEKNKNIIIAVVGLGYVGLPLAVGLAKCFTVIGFDVNKQRIESLKYGHDVTGEVDLQELKFCLGLKEKFCSSKADSSEKDKQAKLILSCSAADINAADIIIVAVPTPVDSHCKPDLSSMIKASITVGRNMKKGAIVVYESTVYPGVTEEICVPVLEQESGLIFGSDFTVGYSPERINPGDKIYTLENIIKIVSGSDQKTLDILAYVYGCVVKAGIHKTTSIKIAEAAKVIENTQRDINIALMNELSLIFNKLNIDTLEVLEAASSKWNFMPFKPGLVGGHCIGVDPYYLTFKAEELGYHPQVILAGRRVNDNMGKYVAEICVKKLIQQECYLAEAKVGILGFSFKENVPDLRNSKVIDIINELNEYSIKTLITDPLVDKVEAKAEYNIDLVEFDELKDLSALILAVPHKQYCQLDLHILGKCFKNPNKKLLLDIKGALDKNLAEGLGYIVWRL